jgi:hypothetical protein
MGWVGEAGGTAEGEGVAGADITVVLSFVAAGCGLQATATNARATRNDERIMPVL